MQAGRHDEPGAGRHGRSGLFFAQYGAGAHMRFRHAGGNGADGLDRRGRAQRDLHDRQSARDQGPGSRHGVRRVLDDHDGYDGRALEQRIQPGSVAGRSAVLGRAALSQAVFGQAAFRSMQGFIRHGPLAVRKNTIRR